MSLMDSFDLSDYQTQEELTEILNSIEYEMSTLRGFQRGATEKRNALQEAQKTVKE